MLRTCALTFAVVLLATIPVAAQQPASIATYTLVLEGSPPLATRSLPENAITSDGAPAVEVAGLVVRDGAVRVAGGEGGDGAVDGARAGSPGPGGVTLQADAACGYDRRRDLATLCFDQYGVAYQPPPPGTIDDNDMIEVFLIVPESDVRGYSATIQGKINDRDLRLVGAAGLSRIGEVVGRLQNLSAKPLRTVLAGQFGPFEAPSFTVTVEGPNELSRTTAFTVNPTYTAALRFAVGDSAIRFNDYGVATFFDGKQRIQNRAPEDGEAREYLNVVLYGWPWEKRFWNGRDVRKPPADLWERINPLVGVGLHDPGDEYLAGISLELTRGLDAFVAVQFAQVEVLGGRFVEGELFPGDPEALPTEQTWVDDVTYGLSVDLRIAADVLGSLFGGG